MLWHKPQREGVAPPAVSMALLRRALELRPDDPKLHLSLAYVHLDRFDFRSASRALEEALRLEPGRPDIRRRLADCYNVLQEHARALELLGQERAPCHERGAALAALGRAEEAETELRAVLARDPSNRQACRRLCRALRRAGRTTELLELCEGLAARGVRNTQLLYDWGIALALNGRDEEARAILFDPARVGRRSLPPPDGWRDLDEFNAALAEELLANPEQLSEFSRDEAANRGSRRIHALFTGRRPALVRALLAAIQAQIDACAFPSAGFFDPWAQARPDAARLQAWGLIQQGGDYEEWHLHRDGWLSGVYYVRVPPSVSAEGPGRGCIEFSWPQALAQAAAKAVPRLRIAPREGLIILAPSHYPHRTIPTETDEPRISVAFDVAPLAVR